MGPGDGQPHGQPFEGHTGGAYCVCSVEVDGRVLLASGGGDGPVRWWDPASGSNVLAVPTHRIAVAVAPLHRSIAMGLTDGLIAIDLSPRLSRLR